MSSRGMTGGLPWLFCGVHVFMLGPRPVRTVRTGLHRSSRRWRVWPSSGGLTALLGVRHPEGVKCPSIRSYLRVMRHKPGFGFGVLSVLCFTIREALADGLLSAISCVALGCAIGVGFFPWWRRRASHDPYLYAYGQPELLDVGGSASAAHPSEPSSNVHVQRLSER
jgi:hypothetical protein